MYRLSDRTTKEVMRLLTGDLNDYEIARRTGASRSTVQRWRRLGPPAVDAPPQAEKEPWLAWRRTERLQYAYLLGAYLGDGHIVRTASSFILCLTLDAAQPRIARHCSIAMASVAPVRVRRHRRHSQRVLVLQSSYAGWGCLFPQWGPGKKHDRPIELTCWQRQITHDHPRELLRGLIHSDGCRCINRFSVKLPSGRVGRYEYPRYFFTNYSADIRRIFCEHCDLLGISWSKSNGRNLSVANRRSVRLLDEFVGPKG